MKEILRGWKEIEDFLGMRRAAILANNFPIRKGRHGILAFSSELLEHAKSLPVLAPAKKDTDLR